MQDFDQALFFDLDHTLIKPLDGLTFYQGVDDFALIPSVIDAIHTYQTYNSNTDIFIVSNQAGVPLDKVSVYVLTVRMANVLKELMKHGVIIRDTLISTTKKTRKPNPFLFEAVAEQYMLHPSRCAMIGDASGKSKKYEVILRDNKWMFKHSSGVFYVEPRIIKDINCSDSNCNEGTLLITDFSDSDKKFAENCRMRYFDVWQFAQEPSVTVL